MRERGFSLTEKEKARKFARTNTMVLDWSQKYQYDLTFFKHVHGHTEI